jgi:hypothetical protein
MKDKTNVLCERWNERRYEVMTSRYDRVISP